MDTDPNPHPLSDAQRVELRERWQTALPHQEAMGDALMRRYDEPHRRYHDGRHLLAVLHQVDELADDDHDLFIVRLAAWFHDAVYDIPYRELTNEEGSARLALRELSRAGLEQEDLTQVARLVRLTAQHTPGSRDPGGELLCDADLAILAAPPQEYAAYVADVRAEYAAVPEREFLAGRLLVLEPFVEAEIYKTSKGRLLTDAARANVTAEVASIAERLGAGVEGSTS